MRTMTVAVLFVTAAACKPSEEGETRTWDANVLQIQEFGGKFAAVKPGLQERQQEAQKAFEAAKGIGDVEQRAEKMRAANELLRAVITPCQEVDKKLREVELAKTDVNLQKLPGYVLMPAMQAIDGQVQQVRASLNSQPVANAGEAIGRLRDASTRLTAAMQQVDQLKARLIEQNRAMAGQPGQPGQPGMPPGQPGQMPQQLGAPNAMPGQLPAMPGQPGAPGMPAPMPVAPPGALVPPPGGAAGLPPAAAAPPPAAAGQPPKPF